MTAKRLLLLLGGEWHDFAGFAGSMIPLLETAGYRAEAGWDTERLMRLHEDGWDAVLMYTCFSGEQETNSPRGLSEEQTTALTRWVHAGGNLLAVHATTVRGNSPPAYRTLLGGEFRSHPPPFSFTIYPMAQPHPILEGISAFTIYDEFYLQACEADITIHLLAIHEGVAYPMAWSKEAGRGRVVYLAPGHFPAVWEHAMYRRLILQACGWFFEG